MDCVCTIGESMRTQEKIILVKFTYIFEISENYQLMTSTNDKVEKFNLKNISEYMKVEVLAYEGVAPPKY